MLEYIRDGQEIYRQSFATIRAEADLSAIPADLEKLEYGVSVTDGCIGWDVTEQSIRDMAAKLRDVLPKRNS